MDDQDRTLGGRIRDIRKRRGLSQRELAELAGVSLSLIRKLEQAERQDARLETVRKLATALRVQTSALTASPDTEDADQLTVILWEPVRRTLFGPVSQPDEPPTVEGVEAALAAVKPAVAANRYADVSRVLPGLLRDSDMLSGQGRHVRSRALNLTGWLLVQARQWEAASTTLRLAMAAWHSGSPIRPSGTQGQVAKTIPPGILHPESASRRRHQLDVARAHAQLKKDATAVGILQQLRADAPEWLVQQRYAKDVLSTVIKRRRTLSRETLELADFLRIAL